jgi:hypothetical protein
MSISSVYAYFKAFEFLIGGEWVGTFADGKTTDHQHFEWERDGKFIHNRHHSTGERAHAGEAIYAYDSVQGKVVFWYWDVTGGISSGHFTVHGDELHAEEEYRGEQNYKMRSVWKPVNANEYDSQQFAWQDDAWQPLWSVRYRRKSS